MYRYVLIALVVSRSLLVHAQFDQRTIYAAGLGAFSYRNTDHAMESSEQRTLSGNIAFGFFPVKKLMIGVASGLLAAKTKSESAHAMSSGNTSTEIIENTSYSFIIGPMARYYVFRGFYCGAAYVAGKGNVKEKYTSYNTIGTDTYPGLEWTQESKAKVKGFSAGIGYSIFLNQAKHLALDLGVSYQQHQLSGIKYSGIAAGFGISGFIFRHKQNENE